jgi:hypothetical protein
MRFPLMRCFIAHQLTAELQTLRVLTKMVVTRVVEEQEKSTEGATSDAHVLAMMSCLQLLQGNSGEMLLDDLKQNKQVGFKVKAPACFFNAQTYIFSAHIGLLLCIVLWQQAIYALVANSLVKIDRSCTPNTVLSLLD